MGENCLKQKHFTWEDLGASAGTMATKAEEVAVSQKCNIF